MIPSLSTLLDFSGGKLPDQKDVIAENERLRKEVAAITAQRDAALADVATVKTERDTAATARDALARKLAAQPEKAAAHAPTPPTAPTVRLPATGSVAAAVLADAIEAAEEKRRATAKHREPSPVMSTKEATKIAFERAETYHRSIAPAWERKEASKP